VSSADETAFAVRCLLDARHLLRPSGAHDASGPVRRSRPAGDHTFLTSGPVDTFRRLGGRFLGPEVAAVEGWQWG
jgi:glutamate racemase